MSTFDIKADFKKGIIPNSITLFGLILAVLSVIFNYFNLLLISIILFAASWISDFFDGWSARKYNGTSQIGAFFDPLADKFCTWIFLYYFHNEIYFFLSIPIVAIGLSLTILRVYKIYYGKKKNIEYNIMAKLSGKIKTNIERSSFAILLILNLIKSIWPEIPEQTKEIVEIFVNIALGASLIFANFSLINQIKEIS